MKNKNISVVGALMAGWMWTCSVSAVQDGQIAPPNVQTVDRFGVNVATGQITLSLDTVSIGGAMGLSHSISGYTNNFSLSGNSGYMDKYAGAAEYVTIHAWEPENTFYFLYNGQNYQHFRVMRVFGPVGSQDFVVLENGQLRENGSIGSGDVTYRAMGDTRHNLEVVKSSDPDGNHYAGLLRWTTPDGTASYYSASSDPVAGRALVAIVYPSGYTIKIHPSGVTTNTGFQLRYERPVMSTGLSGEKLTIRASMPADAQIRTVNPESWSFANPTYIIGINNAVEYCSSENSRNLCDLEEDWPTATFTWPGGMPQAIYLGESIVTIEDATGGVTELHYESHDASLKNLNDPDSTADEHMRGIIWSPRLVGVKSSASQVIDRSYTYENRGSWSTISDNGLAQFTYWKMGSEVGRVISASGPEGSAAYGIHTNLSYKGSGTWAGHNTVSASLHANMPGVLTRVDVHKEGRFNFESSYRNFVTSHQPISGPTRSFEYDSRGNLTKIIFEQNESNTTTMEAYYPSSCTITTRKICNKPIWVKDARGHQTDYQYHAPSGQVATVTSPADIDGRRAQTRYKYEQKYAWYKKNGPSIERADTPVWMLVEEAYCQTGNAWGDGCSVSGDEVVTTYNYGPDDGSEANNLFLKSKTVTTDGVSRTTCYQYDIYGNRIGETAPKAGFNPSNCP